MDAEDSFCPWCGVELTTSEQLRNEMTWEDWADESAPAEVVEHNLFWGEPIPLCHNCRKGIEQNQIDLADEEAESDRKNASSLKAMILAAALVFCGFILFVAFATHNSSVDDSPTDGQAVDRNEPQR